MNIHPHLFHHPKYLRLSAVIGRQALDHLARLWAFCQQDQRGENLGKITPLYVETICAWSGEPMKLWSALNEEIMPGKKGFVHVDGRGNVIATSWNEHNSGLVSNWRQGNEKKRLAALRQKQALKQQRSGSGEALLKQRSGSGEAVTKPSDLRGDDLRGLELNKTNSLSPAVETVAAKVEDSSTPRRSVEVAWPSKKEWLEFCKMIGLVEWRAEKEWLDQERRLPKWKGIGSWQSHANFIRGLWEQDGRPMQPPGARGDFGTNKKGAPSPASQKFALRQEKDALDDELAEHVANENSTAFDPQHTPEQAADYNKKMARARELQKQLAAPIEGGKNA